MLKKQKNSIDTKYHTQIKQFQNLEHSYLNLQKEYDLKCLQLSKLKNRDLIDMTDEELNLKAELTIQVPMLKQQLEATSGIKSVTQYFLDCGSTVSRYYEALDSKSRDLLSFEEITKQNNEKENKQQDNQVGRISQLYNATVDPNNFYQVVNDNIENDCPECGAKREIVTTESILVCSQCFNAESVAVHTDKPSYNDSPCDNICFSYKPINHLKEKLTKVQQKAKFKIPRLIEEQLCDMFSKIQEPYIKHRPPGKTNFTSYSYVINKCLHLLGYPEYAKHFPLLKSKDKLYATDQVWRLICKDLNWPREGGHHPPFEPPLMEGGKSTRA